MKKRLIPILACAMLALCGCTQEQPTSHSIVGGWRYEEDQTIANIQCIMVFTEDGIFYHHKIMPFQELPPEYGIYSYTYDEHALYVTENGTEDEYSIQLDGDTLSVEYEIDGERAPLTFTRLDASEGLTGYWLEDEDAYLVFWLREDGAFDIGVAAVGYHYSLDNSEVLLKLTLGQEDVERVPYEISDDGKELTFDYYPDAPSLLLEKVFELKKAP
ncbi:lipocalin-like domain-containing protein [Eubacteriales bacterium OttesenSCG-928-N14]|nr:lipocalin-like domain-containing protein [Eubacteriales bacterium OttesenSCG-928-N14]